MIGDKKTSISNGFSWKHELGFTDLPNNTPDLLNKPSLTNQAITSHRSEKNAFFRKKNYQLQLTLPNSNPKGENFFFEL